MSQPMRMSLQYSSLNYYWGNGLNLLPVGPIHLAQVEDTNDVSVLETWHLGRGTRDMAFGTMHPIQGTWERVPKVHI